MNHNPSPKTRWKKGQRGNPKGMPPILIPQLRKEIDHNKNAFKKLVLMYLNLSEKQLKLRQSNPDIPLIESMLAQVCEKTKLEGDVLRFRALMEIIFGKIPEEKEEFEVSSEEKLMVLTYRQRCEEQRSIVSDSSSNNTRDP